MKTKALDRDSRKRQIAIAFAVELQDGRTGEMTVTDIARRIGQTPSTHLRIIISEMVNDGWLDVRKEDIPGIAKFRRIYSPNAKQFKKPKTGYKGDSKRHIVINSRQGSFFAEMDGLS